MNTSANNKADLEVAVIGNFQIGKSTFVNCLIGRNDAEVGRGKSTTHENRTYSIGNGVSVIDTPGFNAPGNMGASDEAKAREAIQRSFVVIVYQDKTMGELCRRLIKEEVIARGRKCVLVYNCKNEDRWAPSENDDIIRNVAADAFNCGFLDSCVKLGHSVAFPINAQWALFGLGLLENEKDKRKIRRYARDELGLDPSVDLQGEMLRQSNFLTVKHYIEDLPLEVLSDFLNNTDLEIKRLTDRFCEEFVKRVTR